MTRHTIEAIDSPVESNGFIQFEKTEFKGEAVLRIGQTEHTLWKFEAEQIVYLLGNWLLENSDED